MPEILENIRQTAANWPFLLQTLYLVYFGRTAKSSGRLAVLLLFGGLILLLPLLLRVLPLPDIWTGRLWFNLIPSVTALSLIFGLLPKLQRTGGIWRFPGCTASFSLFAAACLLQHASFALLFPITRYVLPEAAQPYITPLLWSQYTAFAPVFWICCHALTALLLFLDNRIGGRPAGHFSGGSLLAALLFSMLLQTAYIINGLLTAA